MIANFVFIIKQKKGILHKFYDLGKTRMTKHSYDHLFKILLIGDSGVGKTSIMCRFNEDSFRPDMNMTIGIMFFV